MNKYIRVLAVLSAGVLLTVPLTGCRDAGLDKVVVRGEVRYNHKPLEHGQIRFVPIEGTSGPVSGGMIVDGKYVAQGRGGVPLGKHRVEIFAYRPTQDTGRGPFVEGGASEQYLPGKYNGQSVLTAIISKDSASSPVNFDLEGS